MARVTISQQRVAECLQRIGWMKGASRSAATRAMKELFLKHHSQARTHAIPGLIHRTNPHREPPQPGRKGKADWYQFESTKEVAVDDAEKLLAYRFAKMLGMDAK